MNTLRRMTFLIGIAFLVAATSLAQQQKRPPMSGPEAADDIAIRPFHINIPEEQIVDLRQRLAATRWPDKETVNDESQGIRLAEMQALVRYWGDGYNLRSVETKLNILPEFITTIDGVDIVCVFVRGDRILAGSPTVGVSGYDRVEVVFQNLIVRLDPTPKALRSVAVLIGSPARTDDIDGCEHFLLGCIDENIALAMVLALVRKFQRDAVHVERRFRLEGLCRSG